MIIFPKKVNCIVLHLLRSLRSGSESCTMHPQKSFTHGMPCLLTEHIVWFYDALLREFMCSSWIIQQCIVLLKKWVNSWYRKQEILSIRCSSYRLCAIWEFRGGQPIRWLSLSAVSGSNWNLEYSTWFLWRKENQRTCRKNFWARTIAFTNQTHWGHSSGTGEHPHQCTSPKWMLLFVSKAFLSAHFKTHTYFRYLILLWLQIDESLSLCFPYVSNQNTLKKI